MSKAKNFVNSFKSGLSFLGGVKSCKIAPNTFVEDGGSHIVIRLYDTNILFYFQDGTFKADAGQFPTKLTIQRMNQFGPQGYMFKRQYGHIVYTKVRK